MNPEIAGIPSLKPIAKDYIFSCLNYVLIGKKGVQRSLNRSSRPYDSKLTQFQNLVIDHTVAREKQEREKGREQAEREILRRVNKTYRDAQNWSPAEVTMTKEEQESFGPPAQKISHKGVSQSSMALAVAEGENNL